jgi:Asp-tRNA(Asn)/Glu-tRNA(Gln) amidotransferase A subunit family amidase
MTAGRRDELADGVDRGPPHGIPFGVKDITRFKAAGAVITGKVTTMEFPCGMSDPDKPFPVPRNPPATDTGRTPSPGSTPYQKRGTSTRHCDSAPTPA